MKRIVKVFRKILILLVLIITVLGIITFFYMRREEFGALPEGKRLELIKASSHYKDGRFRNIVERPTLTKGYSMPGVLYETLFTKFPHRSPVDSLPSIKTNLKALNIHDNAYVWFGHSSFFLQLDGVKILVDPVFSGKASPIPGSVTAYKGSDIYTVADLPEIDYLLLSHDHYDHLDYETVKELQKKTKHVVCGLGNGAHFERWGYTPDQIIEKDWYESVNVKPEFIIFTESTHHDSGRGFRSGQALWLSFLIQTPSMKVYYSGDGGRDDRFKSIGSKYGKIDWAIMECGQYNKAWQSVHELPEEVALGTKELGAQNLLPVHNSKFTLANHPWKEPLEKITALSKNQTYRLATPMIGELVHLDQTNQKFNEWWKNVQ
ncbi:MBL fold metallo-hydrolase [Chryseobacterium sp. PTM-20240506]|uniref:MBL fold metallo-hydrolase n=1 Tax=unclassified Chryseobacterium TaxID=2593645 RepID=UPI002358B2B1|nr:MULTISPECIES: MBL fold metallo-hydrolase [unclassified Chryseobacterium]MDC8107092.1 MBL fold metallo-hydrolase [Chryseobacterium sp. B21-037]MDQ1802479.1 MBL fold metallo-hydrolase [Chryseobacterium sp. CKR4-1]WBV56295.1 MBL fold metallo-hydrolase [Chryseobacterium daecheongense]